MERYHVSIGFILETSCIRTHYTRNISKPGFLQAHESNGNPAEDFDDADLEALEASACTNMDRQNVEEGGYKEGEEVDNQDDDV